MRELQALLDSLNEEVDAIDNELDTLDSEVFPNTRRHLYGKRSGLEKAIAITECHINAKKKRKRATDEFWGGVVKVG